MAGPHEEDLPSVRVEVDAAPAPSGAPTEASAAPGRQPRLALGTVVALLLAVGVGLFLLSPDSDRAADGTERSAPTTSVPDEIEAPEDSDDADLDEVAVDELSVRIDEPISAIPATGSISFVQVIETEDGYIGLTRPIVESQPPVMRSVDGIEWTSINTAVVDDTNTNLDQLSWVALSDTGNEFVLLAGADGPDLLTRLATSVDGENWTILSDELEPGLPRFGDGSPLVLLEDSIITVDLAEQPIESVIRATTSLELPDGGICGIFRSPGVELRYEMFSCFAAESVFVDAEVVGEEWPAEDVLACLGSLSERQAGPALQIFEVDRVDGSVRTFGAEPSIWDPATLPIPLRLGGVAFVDVGSRAGSGGCEAFTTMPPERPPSLVVLDAENGREGVFSLPDGPRGPIEIGSVYDNFPVGETREFADRAPHLLVSIGGQLWSLNTTWGEWTKVFDPDELSEVVEGGPFTLSTDGDRVYQPTPEGLRIIELNEDEDGVLYGSVRLAPVGPPEWFSSVRIQTSTVLVASNERVLVNDGNGQLWVLEPPLPDVEDASE